MKYFKEQTNCRLCNSTNLTPRIYLSPLPITSPNVGDLHEKSNMMAPTDVYQCLDCGFLQLSVVINPEYQYRNFLYKTNLSFGLVNHFESLMDRLQQLGILKSGSFVFDVGSNDGSLLKLAKARGCKVLGIDPAIEIANEATSQGIPTYGDFFTEKKAQEILTTHGKVDIIISNNTVANIGNLEDLFHGFKLLINKNGLLIIETQYALDVLQKKLLDVIYHEHISYFSVEPMKKFLERMGFELVIAERIAPKGGSIRFIAKIKNGSFPISPTVNELIVVEHSNKLYKTKIFYEFNEYLKQTKDQLLNHLNIIKKDYGHTFAYGSSVGCSALIHYFSIGEIIDLIFDDHQLSEKINIFGKLIPIIAGNQLAKYPKTKIIVLAWRYIEQICKNQKQYINNGGSFFPAIKGY